MDKSEPKLVYKVNESPIEDMSLEPEQKRQFREVAQSSDRILLRIETMFPFTLFPTVIVIDFNKVDIVTGLFFFSKRVFTIMLKDVMTVNVSTSLFFGALEFEMRGYEGNPDMVKFLRKKEAILAHKLLMGLLASQQKGLDISELAKEDVFEVLLKVGESGEKMHESGFGG